MACTVTIHTAPIIAPVVDTQRDLDVRSTRLNSNRYDLPELIPGGAIVRCGRRPATREPTDPLPNPALIENQIF